MRLSSESTDEEEYDEGRCGGSRREFFYVLEGEVVLRIGDERHTAGAGTFAFVPRETFHGFHNAWY